MAEASRNLKRQQDAVSSLNREISQRVDADQSMTLRVKQIEADAKFKEAAAAWAVLSDVETRAAYDADLERSQS